MSLALAQFTVNAEYGDYTGSEIDVETGVETVQAQDHTGGDGSGRVQR